MAQLTIKLLGVFQAAQGDTPINKFEADTARALLTYLVMQAGESFPREALADLLWSDQAGPEALHALRQALSRLRNAIGDREAKPPFLHISRSNIQFNPSSNYWLDVFVFKDMIATSKQHRHRCLGACRACVQKLEQAAELYRGDLLTSFFLDSAPFEEWLLTQREHLHRQAMETFHLLASYYEQHGEYERARAYAWRQVELEPWCEEAHQQLMRTLALTGQRSAALAQYQRCHEILSQEFGIEPNQKTAALYQHILDGRLARATALHNLPTQMTPFIGRESELAQIADMLNDPDCRLITLVGPGGIGKTRLALQAAANELNAFQAGIYFVPLASSSTEQPDFLASALTEILQLPPSPNRAPWDQLYNYLRHKEMLLVLDNFEHLLAEARQVTELLRQAPELRIIVTSRERLNVHGEWSFEVKGLCCPEELGCENQIESSAIQLFIQSAQRMQPNFSLAPTDESIVQHICQLVQGTPLAIELAATWLRVFSCQEIAQEIQNDLDFLRTIFQDTPERHRSMRAVFDSSWALLSPQESQVLSGLSVFRASFDRVAAEQVTGATPLVLVALVDKSLLHQETYPHQPSTLRYELHNLLKQYATERLVQNSRAESNIHNRHCTYYLEIVEQQECNLRGGGQRGALEKIDAEIKNVRAAWEWAIIHSKLPEIDRAIESLYLYYDLRGWFQEGYRAFAKVYEQFSTNPAMGQAHSIVYKSLARQAAFSFRLGQYERAQQQLEQSLRGLQSLDDKTQIAFCLNLQAMIATRQGEYTESETALHQALTLARSTHAHSLEANSLRGLGMVHFYLGNYAQAREYYEQALQISQELGDRFGESRELGNLGLAAYEQNDYKAAQVYYEQAISINREEFSNPEKESWLLNNLGILAADQGLHTQAETYYSQAVHISHEIGDLWGESNALANLGLTRWAMGDYTKANHYYLTSIRIKQNISDRHGASLTQGFHSLLMHYQGDNETALELGYQALAIAEELGELACQAYALTTIGHVLTHLEQLPAARQAYEKALVIRRELGLHNLLLDTQSGLAHIALLQGDSASAQSYVEEILAYINKHGFPNSLEPFRVYLTCYRVLCATAGSSCAQDVLETAYKVLQEHADNISDEKLRRSFLENITTHREIVQEYSSRKRKNI